MLRSITLGLAAALIATAAQAGGDPGRGNGSAPSSSAGAVAVAGAVATGGAASAVGGGAIVNGAGGGYGIQNPQWLLGQTGSAPGFGVPACGEAWSLGIGPITGGQTTESEACVAAREAALSTVYPPGSAGYTRMCLGSKGWREMDKLAAQQCPTNRPKEQVQQAAVQNNAPMVAFDPSRYRTGADCLTAASALGAALSSCANKP